MIGGNRQGYKDQFARAAPAVIVLTSEDCKEAKRLYLATPRFTGLSSPSGTVYKRLMEYGFKAATVADVAIHKMRNSLP